MTPPSSGGTNLPARRRLAVAAVLAVVAVCAVVTIVALVSGHRTANVAPESPAPASTPEARSPSPASASAPRSVPASSGSSSPPTSAAAPSAPASVPGLSDPRAVLRQQVVSGYLAFEKALNQQLSVIAPDLIPLQRVATGQVLANSEDAVGKLRGKGEVERGAPTLTDVVVSVLSPTSAVVCAMEDDGPTSVVVAKTGAVIASGFSRYESRTAMVLDTGVWKASVAASVTSC
jgi:hypothetical protein